MPGVGSYIALAVARPDLTAIAWAIGTMLIVILVYDHLLFRPLVAWADRLRFEQAGGVAPPQSWVLTALRRSALAAKLSAPLAAVWRASYRARARHTASARAADGPRRGRSPDRIWAAIVVVLAALALWRIAEFVVKGVSLSEVATAVGFGVVTLVRVLVLIALAT